MKNFTNFPKDLLRLFAIFEHRKNGRIDLQTISHVLEELDSITGQCIECEDTLGVFSAVYRRTTRAVVDAIIAGRFQDPERMEKLDVVFALHYLEAYKAYRNQEMVPLSWKVAFDAATKEHLTIMQHLLLGMNAHIMLDLCVAAAKVCPGDDILDLEQDFMTVNDVLKELIDEIQDGIGKHSPVWRFIDVVGWRLDERVVHSGIRRARQQAWNNAVQLAYLPQPDFDNFVERLDENVSNEARKIIHVMMPAKPVQWLIRITEKDPIKAITMLKGK